MEPWPLEAGHQLTIQRADTTLLGPDGISIHTHTHGMWNGLQWVPGGFREIAGSETLLTDPDLSRTVATRYRTVVEYVATSPSGADSGIVTATGDVASGGR